MLSNKIKLSLLIATTVLAAFFRLHRIDQLPPGDGYDPAYYGVDALQILDGARPIMLPPNREALFSYVVAACFLVLGASTQAIHIASALVGILTVPATYLVVEELFSDQDGILKRYGGAISALMMALSYWHLNWSRYGVRAILVPLFVSGTFYFLWHGLRTGKRWAFILCGVSLGLSMYTYQATRLIPILIIISFGSVLWKRKQDVDWKNTLIVIGISLLVFAPLGCYFLSHPGSFTYRVEQAFVVEETQAAERNLQAILKQVKKAALAYNFVGDRDSFSTISGRPSLNPFFSTLFFLGIVISLSRIKQAPYLFLLSWLGVLFIPAGIASKAPTAKRAIGTLPAVAGLIAVGALSPWNMLRRWAQNQSPRLLACLQPAWAVLMVGGFAYSGFVTYRDYFIIWGSNPDLFTHFEVGISAIGKYIGDLPTDEQIYVSPELPMHSSIRFHSGLREDVHGYNGRACFVMPTQCETNTTYIIVPHKDGHSLDRLKRHFPRGQIAGQGPLHYNEPYFLAYRIPAGTEATVTPTYTKTANLGDDIQLLGYGIEKTLYQPGDTIHLKLYHRTSAPMDKHYTVFTHLLGPHNLATEGPLWAQDDSEPCRGLYPTTSWQAGEIIIDHFTLPIPPDAPAGTYQMSMGFYDVWTMERLLASSEGEHLENNIVPLGEVKIEVTK
jgi:4-amino-4-deoxy-L-arabinose transferase-like glycosyltransferase